MPPHKTKLSAYERVVMIDDKIISETAKQLGLKDLAPEIYKDLLQPAVREVGNELVKVAKAVCIATAPFELTVWGYNKIKEHLAADLTKKLAQKKPDDISCPDLNIAAPILTNYPLVANQIELRDMYATLLASAMLNDKRDTVHPSFTYLISQLTAEEAVLLKYLYNNFDKKEVLFTETYNITARKYKTESIDDLFKNACIDAGLVNEALFLSYKENLIRLRIFYTERITDNEYVHSNVLYSSDPPYIQQTEDIVVSFTDYGEAFLASCTDY